VKHKKKTESEFDTLAKGLKGMHEAKQTIEGLQKKSTLSKVCSTNKQKYTDGVSIFNLCDMYVYIVKSMLDKWEKKYMDRVSKSSTKEASQRCR
jgi:sugar phosphate permease